MYRKIASVINRQTMPTGSGYQNVCVRRRAASFQLFSSAFNTCLCVFCIASGAKRMIYRISSRIRLAHLSRIGRRPHQFPAITDGTASRYQNSCVFLTNGVCFVIEFLVSGETGLLDCFVKGDLGLNYAGYSSFCSPSGYQL